MPGGESSIPRPLQTCTVLDLQLLDERSLRKGRGKKVITLIIWQLELCVRGKDITGGWWWWDPAALQPLVISDLWWMLVKHRGQ